jgi:hypothetical protein
VDNDVLDYVAGQQELLHLPNIDETRSNLAHQSIDGVVSSKAPHTGSKRALIYQRGQNKPDADEAWAALQKTVHKSIVLLSPYSPQLDRRLYEGIMSSSGHLL